jgi:hypothetical protein
LNGKIDRVELQFVERFGDRFESERGFASDRSLFEIRVTSSARWRMSTLRSARLRGQTTGGRGRHASRQRTEGSQIPSHCKVPDSETGNAGDKKAAKDRSSLMLPIRAVLGQDCSRVTTGTSDL